GVVTAKKVGHGEHARDEKDASAQTGPAALAFLKRYLVLFLVTHESSNQWPTATEYYAPRPEFSFFWVTPIAPPSRLTGVGTPASMRAITLEPPLTWSPTVTAISAPSWSQRSTREPKRTSPTNSPRPTVSPVFFQETTRRATQPAICLKTTSPYSLARVKTFCSLSRDALSAQAAMNFPGLYSRRVMVPAAG